MRLDDVFEPACPVVDADKVDDLASHRQPRPRVVQDRNAGPAQDARDRDAIVVIAENPEYTLRCAQACERRGGIGDVATVPKGHVVPTQDHHVRRLALQQCHGVFDEWQ